MSAVGILRGTEPVLDKRSNKRDLPNIVRGVSGQRKGRAVENRTPEQIEQQQQLAPL